MQNLTREDRRFATSSNEFLKVIQIHKTTCKIVPTYIEKSQAAERFKSIKGIRLHLKDSALHICRVTCQEIAHSFYL